MAVTLFKIGGSLLERPGLAERILGVLSLRSGSRPLLLVGGGLAADAVRRWDAIHHLGDEAAHWLAIRAMGLNERLLERLLPDAAVVSNRNEAAETWAGNRLPILSAFEFLQAEERETPHRLPRSWDVTSDSLAAWIVGCWPADELVLVKSCDPPESPAVSADAVDRRFPQLAAEIPQIGWVNLRSDQPSIQAWRP